MAQGRGQQEANTGSTPCVLEGSPPRRSSTLQQPRRRKKRSAISREPQPLPERKPEPSQSREGGQGPSPRPGQPHPANRAPGRQLRLHLRGGRPADSPSNRPPPPPLPEPWKPWSGKSDAPALTIPRSGTPEPGCNTLWTPQEPSEERLNSQTDPTGSQRPSGYGNQVMTI